MVVADGTTEFFYIALFLFIFVIFGTAIVGADGATLLRGRLFSTLVCMRV